MQTLSPASLINLNPINTKFGRKPICNRILGPSLFLLFFVLLWSLYLSVQRLPKRGRDDESCGILNGHGWGGMERIGVLGVHTPFCVCLPAPPPPAARFCVRFVTLTLRSLYLKSIRFLIYLRCLQFLYSRCLGSGSPNPQKKLFIFCVLWFFISMGNVCHHELKKQNKKLARATS